MEGVWRKAKKALVGGLCVQLPAVAGDREDGASERRASDAVSLDSTAAAHVSAPNTPAATATAMATADASGPSALRRSKSGGKSSKVRPFLFLPCPSKSLPSFRVKICAWCAGNLACEGRGKPCRLRSACRRDGGQLATHLGCFWLELGMDWSNVASPVNDQSPDAVFPWSAIFGWFDGWFSLVAPACVQHSCMHLFF
jgi:hypothetical protein